MKLLLLAAISEGLLLPSNRFAMSLSVVVVLVLVVLVLILALVAVPPVVPLGVWL